MSWFKTVFGFAESESKKRNRWLTQNKKNPFTIGSFDEISLADIPVIIVPLKIPNGQVYMGCKNGRIGYLPINSDGLCDEQQFIPMRINQEHLETYDHAKKRYFVSSDFQKEIFLKYYHQIKKKTITKTPFFSTVKNVILFISDEKKRLQVTHKKTEDVFLEHVKEKGKNVMFQSASQFNYLEMESPERKPSDGISEYIYDNSQGPKCALATPGATLYRNWYLTSNNNQMNGLRNVMKDCNGLSFKNGYIMYDGTSFTISQEKVYELLKIAITTSGIMLNKIGNKISKKNVLQPTSKKDLISNAWCSTIPLKYLDKEFVSKPSIKKLAKQILYATYLLTIQAAVFHPRINTLYLTFVGGGFFGNKNKWIVNAILSAVKKHQHASLKIIILHYKKYDLSFLKYFINDK